MGRGALQVHVDVGSGLRLITCHLKSKLLTYPDNRRYPKNEDERARGAGYALLRRAAEAVAVRVQLNKVMTASATGGEPGMPTIVCGDLNDGPDAVTTTLLAGPDDGHIDRPDKGDRRKAVQPRPASTSRPGVLTHLSRTRRTHRSHPRLPRPTATPRQRRQPRRRHRLDHPMHPNSTPRHRPRPRPVIVRFQAPTPAEDGTIDHQTALSLDQCRLGRSTER